MILVGKLKKPKNNLIEIIRLKYLGKWYTIKEIRENEIELEEE